MPSGIPPELMKMLGGAGGAPGGGAPGAPAGGGMPPVSAPMSTPQPNDGEKQVRRMVAEYRRSVAPKRNPVAVEARLEPQLWGLVRFEDLETATRVTAHTAEIAGLYRQAMAESQVRRNIGILFDANRLDAEMLDFALAFAAGALNNSFHEHCLDVVQVFAAIGHFLNLFS